MAVSCDWLLFLALSPKINCFPSTNRKAPSLATSTIRTDDDRDFRIQRSRISRRATGNPGDLVKNRWDFKLMID